MNADPVDVDPQEGQVGSVVAHHERQVWLPERVVGIKVHVICVVLSLLSVHILYWPAALVLQHFEMVCFLAVVTSFSLGWTDLPTWSRPQPWHLLDLALEEVLEFLLKVRFFVRIKYFETVVYFS